MNIVTKSNPTMRDIAESLGISVTAVSLAINNKPGVTEELREKVFARAHRIGYNLKRLQERGVSSTDLGFLVNKEYLDQGDPDYLRVISEAQAEAERLGYHLQVGALSAEEARSGKIPQFLARGARGVIIDGGFDEQYVTDSLLKRVPVVLYGYDFLDIAVDSVTVDNTSGAMRAVNYLIDNGHRRIGLIWGIPGHSSNVRRRHGYMIALDQAGIPIDPELISDPMPTSEAAQGQAATADLLQRVKGNIDAIFCITDPLATGCMKAIHDFGLKVPDDISVIGFDNMSWVEHLTPPLTTMRVPTIRMGQCAAQRLVKIVENRARGEDEEPMKIELPVELVIRQSVAPSHSSHVPRSVNQTKELAAG